MSIQKNRKDNKHDILVFGLRFGYHLYQNEAWFLRNMSLEAFVEVLENHHAFDLPL